MDENAGNPQAWHSPLEDAPARVSPAKTVAAGAPAVLASVRHAAAEMGVTRSVRVLRQLNQKSGFDCTGCAWPDPELPALAEFCENGVKAAAAAATKQRATPAFFGAWSIDALRQQSDFWLGQQGRLTTPMWLRPGGKHYEPIAWDDAFALIARHLRALDDPNRAVFYTSGRASNEAAFLYQLFARCFGTNNLPDCSNMCHESSGMGLKEVIGVGKGTVLLEDFERTDLIFIVGQNPGTNHPRMLDTLERAKKAGARIVHVNPLPEAGLARFRHPQKLSGYVGGGTLLADVFAQVCINGDVAFFKGVIKHMLEEEERRPGTILSHAFIAERTQGYAALKADLESESWEAISDGSGVAERIIRHIGEMVIASDRIIACWAMGLTQHRNAIANIQSIVNLLLLKGAIGKPGSGVCPVRGHSNVQGDRTMGITPRPSADFLHRLGEEFGFEPPTRHGYDTVDAIRAMLRGGVDVLMALGGNLLSAGPDTAAIGEALGRCKLTVQVSTKLNRSHLAPGKEALILPCLTRMERHTGGGRVSVENSMGIVHASQGELPPASEALLGEPAIVARLAGATLDGALDWSAFETDYDHIRDAIAAVAPGFEDYNAHVRAGRRLVLPNPARDGRFVTPSGKAQFTVHPIARHDLASGEFLMMTIRSHDQFNTTIYGLDDRYRGIKGGRRVVFINRLDAEDAGFEAGAWVDLVSRYDEEERVANRFMVVFYDIPRRCVATYFPEANMVIPLGHTAVGSNTPASKSVVIRLRPAEKRATA